MNDQQIKNWAIGLTCYGGACLAENKWRALTWITGDRGAGALVLLNRWGSYVVLAVGLLMLVGYYWDKRSRW